MAPLRVDKDLTIYIVTKNCGVFPDAAVFCPIQGGRAFAKPIPGAIGDHTGDNISMLNEYYAEMSSLYWVWKNAPRSNYVGFFHYRRFLNFGDPLCPDAPWQNRNWFDFKPATLKRFGWSKEHILGRLQGCDIAVPHIENVMRPPTWDVPCSLYTHYRNTQVSRDINLALDVLSRVHPEDTRLAEEVFSGIHGYFCQLFIFKWDIFQGYMSWLFKILDEISKSVDVNAEIYSPESGQMRVFGFLAERLINVYLEKRRRQGDSFREFERLFAQFPAEYAMDVGIAKIERERIFSRFHNGFKVKALGRHIEVMRPD